MIELVMDGARRGMHGAPAMSREVFDRVSESLTLVLSVALLCGSAIAKADQSANTAAPPASSSPPPIHQAAATSPPATAPATGAPPAASGQIIYPAKGQSPEQQKKDVSECNTWAKDTTGVDPVVLASTPTQTAPAEQGAPVAGGAAKGAAAGALIGAIAGDAGTGAAVGAATGGIGGGVRARRGRQQQAQAAQDAEAHRQALMATYHKAVTACLEGRGYTVK